MIRLMWKWIKQKPPHAVRLIEAMEGVDVNGYPPDPGWGQDPGESLDVLVHKLVAKALLRQLGKESSQPPDAESVEISGDKFQDLRKSSADTVCRLDREFSPAGHGLFRRPEEADVLPLDDPGTGRG